MSLFPIAEQLFQSSEIWSERTLYTFSSGTLTYGETRDAMLNTAAWLRQERGVSHGQRVVICLPTGVAAAQLMLGVLAAGAAYMPAQFNGPAERLAAMITSFEPALLVTTQDMARKLRMGPGAARLPPVVTVDPADDKLAEIPRAVAPLPRPVSVDPESLAAVYFTSGSTGGPKGVMFSHRSMAAALIATMARAELRPDDRLMCVSGLHYAASLKLFNPIASGCRAYVASDDEMMLPEKLAETMERERITVWHATAAQLRQLVENGRLEARDLSALRSVRLVGDRMPVAALRAAMEILPHSTFQNRYGATEAFGLLAYDVPRPLPDGIDGLPIGQPLGCFEQSLRDEAGKEVASGETGEICAIGPGALMGYWKRPDLTAAVRIEGIPNSYRTGDLARLGPDGNYYLVGRRDHQVKIRGQRFELGEIETVLKSHAAVRDAVAFIVSGDRGGQELRACVLSEHGGNIVNELMAICLRQLPVFARPVRIAVVDRFPHLPSGKVDRKALQALEARRAS